MFRLGLIEIVVIVFVCLMIIKPEELPYFLRKAGNLYKDAKKSCDELVKIKDEFVKIADEEVDSVIKVEEKEKTNN